MPLVAINRPKAQMYSDVLNQTAPVLLTNSCFTSCDVPVYVVKHFLKHLQEVCKLLQVEGRVHSLWQQGRHHSGCHQVYRQAIFLVTQHQSVDICTENRAYQYAQICEDTRTKVLTAESINIAIFCNVMQRSLVHRYQHSGAICYFHLRPRTNAHIFTRTTQSHITEELNVYGGLSKWDGYSPAVKLTSIVSQNAWQSNQIGGSSNFIDTHLWTHSRVLTGTPAILTKFVTVLLSSSWKILR